MVNDVIASDTATAIQSASWVLSVAAATPAAAKIGGISGIHNRPTSE
jgi:hypothetical protein